MFGRGRFLVLCVVVVVLFVVFFKVLFDSFYYYVCFSTQKSFPKNPLFVLKCCCRARARAEYPPPKKKTNGEHANRAPFSKRRRRPGSSFFFSFLRSSSRASLVHAKGTTFIPPKGGKTLERHCVSFSCSHHPHRLTKVFFFFFSQQSRAMGKMPSSAASLFQSRRRRLKERRKESDIIIIIIRKRRLRLDGRLQFEILCKRRSRPLVFPQRRASERLKESLRWNNRTLPLPRRRHTPEEEFLRASRVVSRH